MKVLFYCLWGLSSGILLFALLFNHYAEFYLDDCYVDLLFCEYSKQWAYTNVILTSIWLIFSWIGVHLFIRNIKAQELDKTQKDFQKKL